MNSPAIGLRSLGQQQHLCEHLSPHEIQQLDNMIGENCDCKAAAVVQVLHEHGRQWRKHACGVLCFLADYNKRILCFRLYDLRFGRLIDEEFVSSSLQLDQVQDRFYTFNGQNCRVGINFADRLEAEMFRERFRMKQQSRQNKKRAQTSAPVAQETPKLEKKSSGWPFRSKKAPVISAPIVDSFEHKASMAPTKSFVDDDLRKQMLQTVLNDMKISSKERLYIQQFVQHNSGALTNLFAPSPALSDNRQPQPNRSPPTIPSQALPAFNANEAPAPPSVPPRLPPPLPTNPPPTRHVAPVLHLPTPVIPAAPANPNSGSFTDDIAKFDRGNLKPTTQRELPAPEKIDSNTKRTLEENIVQMLAIRRKKILADKVESESDWDSDE